MSLCGVELSDVAEGLVVGRGRCWSVEKWRGDGNGRCLTRMGWSEEGEGKEAG